VYEIYKEGWMNMTYLKKIEFAFVDILDSSLIKDEIKIEDPFGLEATRIIEKSVDYYKDILKSVINEFHELQSYEYKGCFERISNEVFIVQSNQKTYEVVFKFDTFEKHNQLTTIDDK
jgi:hypothetical protein